MSVPAVNEGNIASCDLTSTVLNPNVNDYLSFRNIGGDFSTKPKAYINAILLDDQFKAVNTDDGKNAWFDQVGDDQQLKPHLLQEREITKNGYLYIYTCNETQNVDVFFDNLQVTHIRGPLVEETHYYPFGLTMSGISSKALKNNYAENKYKYNGIEFDNDLDLNEYEAYYRDLDPQTGRWWQIDPKVDAGYENVSPYASMYDDPEKFSDPLGDEAEENESCCKYLKNAFASLAGAIVGAIDNNIPGSNIRGAIANSGIIEDPEIAESWNTALDAADAFGMVQGAGEGVTGTGLLNASLAVTAGTGGASIEITGPGALVGGGLAVHGLFVSSKSAGNLMSQNGRVEIHGNNKSSTNSQHGYEIKDKKTGDVHKYGISGEKLNKNGTSRRANTQVNKLNKAAGADRYSARVVKKNMAGRGKGLNWEKGKVKGYKKANTQNQQPKANILPQVE